MQVGQLVNSRLTSYMSRKRGLILVQAGIFNGEPILMLAGCQVLSLDAGLLSRYLLSNYSVKYFIQTYQYLK